MWAALRGPRPGRLNPSAWRDPRSVAEVIVGAELHLPYDRLPLSKDYVLAAVGIGDLALAEHARPHHPGGPRLD